MVLLLLIINDATTASDLVSRPYRIIQAHGKVGIINQNTLKYKKKMTLALFRALRCHSEQREESRSALIILRKVSWFRNMLKDPSRSLP
jgi:hypothetical protein